MREPAPGRGGRHQAARAHAAGPRRRGAAPSARREAYFKETGPFAATCCAARRCRRAAAHGPADHRGPGHHRRRPAGLAAAGRGRLHASDPGTAERQSMRDLAATDPATFEVVKNALYCAAEEMKVVLAKTAYSPLLKVAGRLLLRPLRRARRDGRAGARSAHPSRLDAAGGEGGHPRLPAVVPTATCSSTTIPTSAAATCPTSTSSCPPSTRAAAGLRVRARPLARHRQQRPAPTAPPPRSTARGCGCRRCGCTRRRAEPRRGGDHLHQRAHAGRAQRRPPRPARRQSPRHHAAAGAGASDGAARLLASCRR